MKPPSRLSPIGSRRRSRPCCWRRWWSRGSTSSYGYRPGRSQLDAVAACRQRCFTHSWVLDCDIAGFFDNVPHDLIVKAVEANTDQKWVVLYVERWLKAPLQHPDGTLEQRDRGTPKGQRTADPCGVPLHRSTRMPSGYCSGAASHRFTYSSTQRQSVTACTAMTMRSHGTSSKNFWTSRSIVQSNFQHRGRHASNASWAEHPGR